MAINRTKHRRTKFVPPPVDQPPSEGQINIFIATYEETFSEFDARKQAKISRAALDRLKQDPAFLARMEEAYNGEDYRERLRATARKLAILGNKDIILGELKAEFPEVYNSKQSIDVNINVKEATDEELEAILKGRKNR